MPLLSWQSNQCTALRLHLAKDRRTDKTWSYLGSGGDEIRDRPAWWRDGPTMGPVLVHLDGSWSRTQKKLWGELSWGGSGVLLEPYEHLSASQPLVTWKEEQAQGLKHSGCVTPGNDFLHLKIIRLKTEMTSPFKKKISRGEVRGDQTWNSKANLITYIEHSCKGQNAEEEGLRYYLTSLMILKGSRQYINELIIN